MRTRLSWLAAVWVVVQLTTILGAPVALYASAPAVPVERCLCALGHEGQQCPMHSHHDGRHDDRPRCAIRSTVDPSDALLLTIIAAALVPPALVPHDLPQPVAAVAAPATELPTRVSPPDAPPPRA